MATRQTACNCNASSPYRWLARGRNPAGSAGGKPPGILKRFTENAGAVALTLGLVLSLISLYDVAVRKPEADRLAAITQFNQTVNSAAKTRQELIQTWQGADPASRLAIASMATPRILNDIATARAMLPKLKDEDVGIPQLLILISESITAGDNASAKHFLDRAVGKPDVPAIQAAEALRYQGKYRFVIGDPAGARASFLAAINSLGTEPMTAAARAFDLTDLIAMEFAVGSCAHVEEDIAELKRLLRSNGVPTEARTQMLAALNAQLAQYGNQQCSAPASPLDLATP